MWIHFFPYSHRCLPPLESLVRVCLCLKDITNTPKFLMTMVAGHGAREQELIEDDCKEETTTHLNGDNKQVLMVPKIAGTQTNTHATNRCHPS